MWALLAKFILRTRIPILVLLAIITGVMIVGTTKVKLFYGLPKLLPDDDPAFVNYEAFKERFKAESTTFVVGIDRNPVEDRELFNDWYELGQAVTSVPGVDTVLSITHLIQVQADTAEKKFIVGPVVDDTVSTVAEMDSIKRVIKGMPFYEGLIFTDTSTLMAVSLNNALFNSEQRGPLLDSVLAKTEAFTASHPDLTVFYSGLPYIRTKLTTLVKSELQMFVIMAIVVTVLILFLFFRSVKPVMVSMMVVGLGVAWSVGMMGWFHFEITVLTSIIPPLIIVIGIPNCIYLINKYHSEFKLHGNRPKALTRVVQKIGKATFITNATTSVGFLTFIFTESEVLVEFGIVASMSIMLLFVISLLVITTVFSFLGKPKEKLTAHLETGWIKGVIRTLLFTVENRRNLVYGITAVIVVVSFYGVSLIETTGNIVDDLPRYHRVTQDLKFFENQYNGVMPFEVDIDMKKKNMAMKSRTLKRIEEMQDVFAQYPQFSEPISVVEGVKFMRQAFHNGNPERYTLIPNNEGGFFEPYFKNSSGGEGENVLNDFVDTTGRYARVSLKMADVGTKQMDSLIAELEPRIDSIFNPKRPLADSLLGLAFGDPSVANRDTVLTLFYKKFPTIRRALFKELAAGDKEELSRLKKDKAAIYTLHSTENYKTALDKSVDEYFPDITLTGASVVFLEGTNYLVKNLFISLSIAIFIVGVIMALFFSSARMIAVSLIVNLIPLLVTAAMMGYFGISIKPSTILVFSIAFGISVDDTIHFLAKYRQELRFYKGEITRSVVGALKETGVSMVYTSIILFFGFSVFDSSEFGGTMALGILVSLTLLIAMLANLVLLPAFLMTMAKNITTKAFREPYLEMLDEEEDIDLTELTVPKNPLIIHSGGASPEEANPNKA